MPIFFIINRTLARKFSPPTAIRNVTFNTKIASLKKLIKTTLTTLMHYSTCDYGVYVMHFVYRKKIYLRIYYGSYGSYILYNIQLNTDTNLLVNYAFSNCTETFKSEETLSINHSVRWTHNLVAIEGEIQQALNYILVHQAN